MPFHKILSHMIVFFLFIFFLVHRLFNFIGFSDPYCMLGIQPASTPVSPLPPLTSRTLSDVGFDNNLDSPHHGTDKLRKHHSFRLSFKRKDGRREHRDSLSGPVPAKFIRATSIKSHTLSPKWHEKFKLYVYFDFVVLLLSNGSFFLSSLYSFFILLFTFCLFSMFYGIFSLVISDVFDIVVVALNSTFYIIFFCMLPLNHIHLIYIAL